jgi:hypothetical protein
MRLRKLSWFGLLVLAAAAISGFGCARPQDAHDKLAIIGDPGHMLSHRRWEVLQLPGETSTLASITDSTGDVVLALSCEDNKSLGLLIGRQDGGKLKDPSLTLHWDGAPAGEDDWQAVEDDNWGFGLLESRPTFWASVTRLKQYRSLEAVVHGSDRADQHYHFTLYQAAEAIDYVLGKCGKRPST